MTLILLLGVVVVAVLVWVGRRPTRLSTSARITTAAFAGLAAVAAIVSALKGGWIASLILVAASAYLGQRSRPGPAGAPPPRDRVTMSAREAREILGVDDDADREAINGAYRRLMLRAHPDHGGTVGLASRLNAARDRLLKAG